MEFSKKICQIKDLIIEKINSINIFSKELTIVNKVIVLLAILITINLPQNYYRPISNLPLTYLNISKLTKDSNWNELSLKRTRIKLIKDLKWKIELRSKL